MARSISRDVLDIRKDSSSSSFLFFILIIFIRRTHEPVKIIKNTRVKSIFDPIFSH